MRFEEVSAESADRVRQVTFQLRQIKALEDASTRTVNEAVRTQKGLVFVCLYAAIEHVAVNATSSFLLELKGAAVKPSRYQNNLLSIVLDRQLRAVVDSGKKNLWAKKGGLFERLFSDRVADIDESVFPTDGINIGLDQLIDLWTHLHLPGGPIPQSENSWYLGEIKENRNAISHGRMTAFEVGQRYTLLDLEKRHAFVSSLCSHVIATFQQHVVDKTYLRSVS